MPTIPSPASEIVNQTGSSSVVQTCQDRCHMNICREVLEVVVMQIWKSRKIIEHFQCLWRFPRANTISCVRSCWLMLFSGCAYQALLCCVAGCNCTLHSNNVFGHPVHLICKLLCMTRIKLQANVVYLQVKRSIDFVPCWNAHMGYFVQWDGVLLVLDASLTRQEELGKWNLESNEFEISLHSL